MAAAYFSENYERYKNYDIYGNYTIIPIAPLLHCSIILITSTAPTAPITSRFGLRPGQTYQLGQRESGMCKGEGHPTSVGQ